SPPASRSVGSSRRCDGRRGCLIPPARHPLIQREHPTIRRKLAAERRLAGQSRVAVQEADGLGLGVADQSGVEQICHLELIAMLLDAMQVTHPAVLEVDLSQVEAAA